MHKSVFQTDDDGLFLYETVANDLPLSPGAYNVPFGAYPDAPPAGGSGRWPRWTGNGWQMVEDHRATPLWVAETGSPMRSAARSSCAAVLTTCAIPAGDRCPPG